MATTPWLFGPGTASASDSQCPASEPLHFEGFAPPWDVPASGVGGQTILSLDAEVGRHYKRMMVEFDFTIDDFDAASDFIPIVWVRNQPFEVEPGPPQYDWFLTKNSNPQRIVSIVENEVLDFQEPATWTAGSTYSVRYEMDAETGLLTITTDDGAGGTNMLQRPFEQSIVAFGNGLRLIWGWHEVNLDIVYPPWGWTFSNLVVDMEPGGPMGPLAVECPGGLDWVTAALPGGEVDVPYGPVALEAMAGMGTHTFTVEDGSALPDGLQLLAGGSLDGTPSSGGDYTFALRVTDDNAEYITGEFSIHVHGPAAGDESGGPDAGGSETGSDDSAATSSADSDGSAGGESDSEGEDGGNASAGGSATTGDDALPADFGGNDDAGCGCHAPARGGGLGWGLLLMGLIARRRRSYA